MGLKRLEVDEKLDSEFNKALKPLGKRKRDVLEDLIKKFLNMKKAAMIMEVKHLPPKLTGRNL